MLGVGSTVLALPCIGVPGIAGMLEERSNWGIKRCGKGRS
jgi:hypothetical protein